MTNEEILTALRERLGTPHCGLSGMFEVWLLQEVRDTSPEQQAEFIASLGPQEDQR